MGQIWYKVRGCVPLFVRVLGGFWYKVRQSFPHFVRDLGQIWYKVRKVVRALRFKREGRSSRNRTTCCRLCIFPGDYQTYSKIASKIKRRDT
ncbi:hypothetical protein HMPREF1586_01118 [Gardnerella vaginalis JCP8522]|nr:hypothetical protein HMPREF1586_01118 [Gardnerella vaginalis JCP8522]